MEKGISVDDGRERVVEPIDYGVCSCIYESLCSDLQYYLPFSTLPRPSWTLILPLMQLKVE